MTSSPDKFSVLLLDDQGHHSPAVVACLGNIKGVKLHVLSNIPRPAVRFSRFVATFHQYTNPCQEAAQVDEILRVCQTVGVDVLLPITENSGRLLSRHRDAFAGQVNLAPLPPAELLETVSNKSHLAVLLNQHGLPSPATLQFRSLKKTESALSQLDFPILFKPVVSGGGSGIRRFDAPTALLEFLRGHKPAPGACVLQSFIPGCDVDCSVLCCGGRILAHTVQMSLRPRKNPFATDDAIEITPHANALAVVGKTMAVLRWEGIAHLDLREDGRNGNIYIVDFNPRFWLTLLGSLAAGVNFPYLACLAGLGIEFSPPAFRHEKYFAASAALKELVTGRWDGSKSGLPYALRDPLPRIVNLAKRLCDRSGRQILPRR